MQYQLQTPLTPQMLRPLRAGDDVLLSGEILTARDAAHQRIAQLLADGKQLPFTLAGSTIYYAGPTPAPPGLPVGSIGPTTSGRMDKFTPLLLRHGLVAMIGKGPRSAEVMAEIQKTGAVYFGFIGGAGALAASCVLSCQTLAWPELGSEAIRRLVVQNLPLTVLADTVGGDLYSSGPAAYLAQHKSTPQI